MENNNNVFNNGQPAAQTPVTPAAPAPAPAPAPGPVQTIQPQQMTPQPVQQYQQPYQQPVQAYQPQYQQPGQPQYQQPYQQQYQQIQPQFAAPQDQAGKPTSEYDLLSREEKADRKKKANLLCFISLGLQVVPELISGVMTGIIRGMQQTTDIASTSEVLSGIISILFGGSYIASWVLMIIARVKYKESKFAKILMWVYIGIFAASVLAVILIIAMCAYMLKDCQGF